MAGQPIERDILEILSGGTIEGNVFRLNCGQLDRKTYERVNKILDILGGKWNRKAAGHTFGLDDPAVVIDQAILTGEVGQKNPLEFFETPPELADQMVSLADLRPEHSILEPSAGLGAIIDAIPAEMRQSVSMIELDPQRRIYLEAKYERACIHDDFLTYRASEGFDRILMNPPFSKGRDIQHVEHAFYRLAPGGRLVAIMSSGVNFRQERKFRDFRDLLVCHGGKVFPNPDGAFKNSGTGVSSVTVVLNRNGISQASPGPRRPEGGGSECSR